MTQIKLSKHENKFIKKQKRIPTDMQTTTVKNFYFFLNRYLH